MAPGCWDLFEMQYLPSLLAAGALRIHQCGFGACSMKPTRFMITNLPRAQKMLDVLPTGGKRTHTQSARTRPKKNLYTTASSKGMH